MRLLIDIGNTRMKWVVATTSDDLATQVQILAHQDAGLLGQRVQQALAGQVLEQVYICCVAQHDLARQVEQQIAQYFPAITVRYFHAQAETAGLRNGYLQPQQLGADRFASAIAVRARFPNQAALVVTAGTATTIDVISADGVFSGGMIIPGLKMMAMSLARNTAQLPAILDSLELQQPFARATDQAILSGCIHAQWGAITSAAQRWQAQHQEPVQLILSGGAAPYLQPYQNLLAAGLNWQYLPNLVLTGLFHVAQSEH